MKPAIICLTPVKNEAWILDRFLTAASLWYRSVSPFKYLGCRLGQYRTKMEISLSAKIQRSQKNLGESNQYLAEKDTKLPK
ncbi:MAG: hypothetical protein LBR66_01915 [Candidatus Symbiothrix sp.]|nr:hypothetical protein [Candidatus Symbiothrix sp.]